MTEDLKEARSDGRHRGPSLLAVAIVFTVLFVASLIGSIAMAGGEHYPSPYLATPLASIYFTEHANAVRLSSFLQFGAPCRSGSSRRPP